MTSDEAITATFTAASAVQQVVSYSLMSADTNLPIAGYDPLPSGAVLNLAALPTRRLNVRANTSPAAVGSVVFVLNLNGALARRQTETVVPLALFGDANGKYNPWTPALGSYSLTATPYTAGSGTGTPGVRPATLAEVPAFLRRISPPSAGQPPTTSC